MSTLGIENLAGKINPKDIQEITQGMGRESTQDASGRSFTEILKDSLDQVNQQQVQADEAIKELVAGKSKNLHETMLTVERADASLKLMMQVRNKILEAYKEVMRMQV